VGAERKTHCLAPNRFDIWRLVALSEAYRLYVSLRDANGLGGCEALCSAASCESRGSK
jgi:hypothetical protein